MHPTPNFHPRLAVGFVSGIFFILIAVILLLNNLFKPFLCRNIKTFRFLIHRQVVNASEAFKEADNYPDIRLFTASEVFSDTPLYELQKIEQPWSVASSGKERKKNYTVKLGHLKTIQEAYSLG